MKRILVIEDQIDYQLSIKLLLDKNYHVVIAGSGIEALQSLEGEAFDLILLDVVLPDAHGFEFIATMKEKLRTTNTPVIFLTAKNDIKDRVQGLGSGAVDYIVKPFEPLEFEARIAAHLRTGERSQNVLELKKGRWVIDRPNRKCYVLDRNNQRTAVALTPHEFEVLCYLMANDGRVLSRTELMERVWNNNVHVLSRTVDRHISALRRKLDPEYESLESIHGEGYRFVIKKSDAA